MRDLKFLLPGVLALALLSDTYSVNGAGRQLTGVYAPAATPPLPPEEAARKMVLPDGFEARIFAFEPDVVNPVAMTWDERGRLWVVELYEYPLGAAPGTKPRDKVKILEDTDNDGRADKVTVFADGLNLATGILLGYGGVFVGQAPHLLFLEDTDGDDKADRSRIVKTGFGLEDRHELLNGFTWGPDGYLYMTHGVFTYSKVKNPEDPDDDGVTMTAAVARYHPRSQKFEVYAEGTSNPWGVDFDRAGNAFVSACVIDHLFHMAPGGIYQRQAGTPPHPYAYEQLPSIVDHKHFRAAYAGIQVYQGDQYPSEYLGTIFMGNIHDNSLHQDRLTPRGSTFKASAIRDFLRANDGWFRPVSVQTGPDGALWIMDWYDKYPCYQNANADPEGVDRAHGRIWRVVYTGKEKGKPVPSHPPGLNLKNASSAELVEVLNHPNSWHRRMAQRILSERLDPASRGPLLELYRNGQSVEARSAALWTLHALGYLDEAVLDAAAADDEPIIRKWAARLTGERNDYSPQAAERLKQLGTDHDAQVRLAVAVAARQYVSSSLTINTTPLQNPNYRTVGEILSCLVLHPDSAKDPVIPFMIWMAAEPMIAENPEPALRFLAQRGTEAPRISAVLALKTMRRICDSGNPEHLRLALQHLAEFPEDAAPITVAAIDGLIEGQRGKPFRGDENSTALLAKLRTHSSKEVVKKAEQLGAAWGDAAALDLSIQTALDDSRTTQERTQAIELLRRQKLPAVREGLQKLVASPAPEPVLNAAIQGLMDVGGENSAYHIVDQWKKFTPSTRRIAADALMSRQGSALALLSGVERKIISLDEIPMSALRRFSSWQDDFTKYRVQMVIGKLRDSDPDKSKLIEEKRRVVLSGLANLENGRQIAQKTCLTCHKLHGVGAEVGPDLTGVGRSSLDALLANIIDPNQLIGTGYENVEVETRDGRTVAGRLVENTDTRVKILSVGPKEEVIAKSEIENLRVSELSVMPEGLEQMPEEDFRDMIWFLLNPPEDDKAVSVLPVGNKLVVKGISPGSEGVTELVSAPVEPGKRTYLHPVKDVSGRVTLTQDRPEDHPWQHGIFTGLQKVNGVDFWSERGGKQRFVRLLNVYQEQDHAGWTGLSEWVAPDGGVLLDEEQTVKVYAPRADGSYIMDIDWTLRSKGQDVVVGQHEYGGLALRMDLHPKLSHLNANGQRGKETANQRAPWCSVFRPFGDQVMSMTIFDHPTNPGFPAKWRVDNQGLINPSPSLQGEWRVRANAQVTYHYRIIVQSSPADQATLDRLFESFAALRFGPGTLKVSQTESNQAKK